MNSWCFVKILPLQDLRIVVLDTRVLLMHYIKSNFLTSISNLINMSR